MRIARMGAGGEGVEPPDPVGKPLFYEKIERPVGDGRLLAIAFRGKPIEHVVGAQSRGVAPAGSRAAGGAPA